MHRIAAHKDGEFHILLSSTSIIYILLHIGHEEWQAFSTLSSSCASLYSSADGGR